MSGGVFGSDGVLRAKEPPVDVPDVTIAKYAFQKLDEHGARPLFIQYETGACLKGQDIIVKSKQLATALLNRYELTRDDVVALYSGNLVQYVIAQYGVIAIGLTFSPITINCKAIEILRQVDDCKATIIFTSRRNAPIIAEVCQKRQSQIKAVIVLDGDYPGFTSLESLLDQVQSIHPRLAQKVPYFDDLDPKRSIFAIIYTSGSTGMPKGAALSHHCLLSNVLNTLGAQSISMITFDGTTLGTPPLTHSSGVIWSLSSIVAGSKMVLVEVPDPQKLMDCIQKYRVTVAFINASMGQYLISNPEADSYDLSSLKQMRSGGAAFPPKIALALIIKYGVIFREAYGATEMNLISAPRIYEKYQPGSVGSPIPSTLVKVLDLENGQVCKPGKKGEVLLSGPSRIIGYINRPDANQEAFNEDGWYRTGDIGYISSEGNLFLVDRIKHMIKYLGYAVYPAECESILYMHDEVKSCVVVSFPHPVYGELPRAYVVLKDGASVTEFELEEFVAERIADQKRLRGGIRFVEDIPLISMGKPNRKYFKDLSFKESSTIYRSLPESQTT